MPRLRHLAVLLVLAVLSTHAHAEPTTGNGGGLFGQGTTGHVR